MENNRSIRISSRLLFFLSNITFRSQQKSRKYMRKSQEKKKIQFSAAKLDIILNVAMAPPWATLMKYQIFNFKDFPILLLCKLWDHLPFGISK